MSKNEVKVTIKIDDNGTLKATTKEASGLSSAIDGVTTSTNKLNKSKGQHNKLEKGTAGLTSNSTKAFSKQAQSLGGGNGLVAAYATLAANIFAITAAFGALRRAAGFEQLQAGLIHTGNAAGANLPKVAQSLREITGAAISTKDAMEAVALGTSAGFSTKQLEGLTKVAKGASLALGRDMSDAMSRLVRGASKLEPEILDELGIMVRLDTVTQNYATTIGKTAGQLTQFERRMAFTNAIIQQGEKKFGAIAEAIDPNAYDQLSASFSDITQTFLSFLNTALIPVVKFFSSNIGFLVAGAIAFASTLTKQIAPGMYASAKAASANAAALSALAIEQRALLGSVKLIPKSYNANATAIQQNVAELALLESQQTAVIASTATLRRELADLQIANTLDTKAIAAKNAQIAESEGTYNNITAAVNKNKLETEKAYKKLNSGLNKSIKRNMEGVDGLKALKESRIANTKALLKGEIGLKSYIGLIKEENILIAAKKKLLKPVIAERARLRKEIYLQSLSSVKLSQANALEAISELGVVAASKLATKAIMEEVIATKIATIDANLLSTSLIWVAASSRIAAFAMKFVGVAFLKFLPVIGLAIMAFSMLAPLVSGLFGDSDLEKELNEITEGFDSFNGIANQLSTTLEDSTSIIDNYISTLSVAVGVFGQIGTAASKARDAVSSVYNEQILAAQMKAKQYEDAAAAGYMGSESDMQYWEGRADAIKQEADKRTKLAVLQTVNIGLDKLQENSSLAESLNTQITAIKALNLQYNNGKISVNAYLARLSNMQGVMKATEQTIKGAGDEMSAYSKALIGLHKKADNPFTPTIKAVSVMQSSLSDLSGDILAQEGYMQKLSASNSVAYDSFIKLGSASLAAVSALNGFGDHSTEGDKLAAGLKIASDLMKDYQQDVDLATTKAKEHSRIIKGLKGLSKVSTEAISASYKEQNSAIDDQISLLKKARVIELSLGNSTLVITKQIDELKASRPKEAKKLSDIAAVELNNKKTLLNLESKSMGLLKEKLALETSIASEKQKQLSLSYGPTATSDSSTSEELALWEDQKKSKEDFIKDETKLKVKTINMEYALLEAKFKLLTAQADANPAITLDKDFVTSYTAMLAENKAAALKNNTLKQTNELSKITTKGMELHNKLAIEAQALTLKQVESLTSMLDLERSLTEEKNKYNESIALISGVEGAKASLDLFREEAAERRSLIEYETSLKIANNTREIGVLELKNLALLNEGKDTATNDADIAALEFANRRLEIEQEIALVRNDTEGIQKQARYIDKVATVYTNMIKVMADTDLGKTIDTAIKPITSIVQTWAAANMSITQDKENQAKNSKKISEKTAHIQSAFAAKDYALANKLGKEKASLEKKNADLTNTIEEKKHKSNLSMATTAMGGAATIMKSLADQQDTSSKKGFESAKKMQLASAVMSTAAAIMGAFAMLPNPQAMPMAALAAATGAIQIATIAATSFGGSSAAPSAPAASMGSSSMGKDSSGNITGKGTVLGKPQEYSDSSANIVETLDSIHASELAELRNINQSLKTVIGRDTSALLAGLMNDALNFDKKGKVTGFKDLKVSKYAKDYGTPDEFTRGAEFWFGKTKTKIKSTKLTIEPISVNDLFAGSNSGITLSTKFTAYTKRVLNKTLEGPVQKAFTNIFKSFSITLEDSMDILGGSYEDLNNYIYDIGNIDLKGLNADEVEEKLNGIISATGDIAARDLFWPIVSSYQKFEEGAMETIVRISSGVVLFENFMQDLGTDIPDNVIAISHSLIELTGGLEAFSEATSTFFDTFYSDTEKFNRTSTNLTEVFSALNIELPDTRQGFADLMEQIDYSKLAVDSTNLDNLSLQLNELNTAAAVELDPLLTKLASLQSVVDAPDRTSYTYEVDEGERGLRTFTGYTDNTAAAAAASAEIAILNDEIDGIAAKYGILVDNTKNQIVQLDGVTSATEDLIVALFDNTEAADEYYAYIEKLEATRFDLGISLLDALGMGEKALAFSRQNELNSMDESLWALQRSVWAAEDAAEAEGALADARNDAESALKDAFSAQKDIINEYFSSLIDGINESIKTTSKSVSSLSSAVSALESAENSFTGVTKNAILNSIDEIRNLSIEVPAGDLSGLEDLGKYLKVLTSDNTSLYSNYTDYNIDYKKSQAAIAKLKKETSNQLSIEEQTLKVLKEQLESAKLDQKRQLNALDAQLDAILGVDTSVRNIEEATSIYNAANAAYEAASAAAQEAQLATLNSIDGGIYNLAAVLSDLEAYTTPKTTNSPTIANSVVTEVGKLYDDLFGRVGDAAGVEYWNNTGLTGASLRESMISAAAVEDSAYYSSKYPAYASGGSFSGGYRLVGEKGPEIEYTGASQIYNKDQLFNTDSLEEEIRALRNDLKDAQYQIAKNTSDTARQLSRWDGDGMPQERDVA